MCLLSQHRRRNRGLGALAPKISEGRPGPPKKISRKFQKINAIDLRSAPVARILGHARESRLSYIYNPYAGVHDRSQTESQGRCNHNATAFSQIKRPKGRVLSVSVFLTSFLTACFLEVSDEVQEKESDRGTRDAALFLFAQCIIASIVPTSDCHVSRYSTTDSSVHAEIFSTANIHCVHFLFLKR